MGPEQCEWREDGGEGMREEGGWRARQLRSAKLCEGVAGGTLERGKIGEVGPFRTCLGRCDTLHYVRDDKPIILTECCSNEVTDVRNSGCDILKRQAVSRILSKKAVASIFLW